MICVYILYFSFFFVFFFFFKQKTAYEMRISDWSSDVCSSDLTILLQAVAQLARRGTTALYVSGEEAVAQIGLRAQRLGLADAPVMLAAANSLRDILAGIDTAMAQEIGRASCRERVCQCV